MSDEKAVNPLEGRHSSTVHIMQQFRYGHLPIYLQQISVPCAELAFSMLDKLQDGPELTAGLRKLLEAKDCLVRQAVIDGTN